MSAITATELELLSFFEDEPTLSDPGVAWIYNDASYAFERDGMRLTIAIAPSYRDVRIILQNRGITLYELNAIAVDDVRIRTEHGQEHLEIAVSENHSVRVFLKPSLKVTAAVRRLNQ